MSGIGVGAAQSACFSLLATPSTITIVHATHMVFERRVRSALLGWHFSHFLSAGNPLADSVALRISFVIPECRDSSLISMAEWHSDRWPPELRITHCPEGLVPRDEVF
jgi:hypothetical protein